jgi:hypothetical protein
MVEVARYCHTRGGGAVACLDAQFAYDRTRISFLKLILEAMKFPPSFINIINTLYDDNWARLKVNGHIGDAFRKTNGLLQGLPSSCPLWNIYIEPFVRYLHADPNISGVTIPGEMGVGNTTLKVAAFADDVKSYLANMTEVEYLTTRADSARPGYSYATGDGPLAVWYGAKSTA